ncbi:MULTISPECIES: STAS domain-containing protein [Colwelliaceae]|uniref:STAS domain-containing protein n=1 Tax=Colwelliaceae TaxID=267889 RepID=UPI0009710F8D|nr:MULTISPECIES: STAS domain-containing protein [Colwelliaceae]
MAIINWSYEQDIASFQGELSMNTIDIDFENKTINAFHNKSLVIDLAGVVKADTAGLAWLLRLVEEARKTKSEISFHNIPQDLLKLAKLSAVDLFLPTKI